MPQIKCTQCGAPLSYAAGQERLPCPFCGTVLTLTAEFFRGQKLVKPTYDVKAAVERFWRWVMERDKPVSLRKAKISQAATVWLPVWHIDRFKTQDSSRQISSELVRAFSDKQYGVLQPERVPLKSVKELKGELEGKIVGPSSTIDQMKEELQGQADGFSLVWVPAVELTYNYKGAARKLLVEGMTGEVHAAYRPKKPRWPFITLTMLYMSVCFLTSCGLVVGLEDYVAGGLAAFVLAALSIPFLYLSALLLVRKV